MKRIFYPITLLFAGVLLFASCLGDDTNSDITYYNDAAISSFALGTLNRNYVDNQGNVVRKYDNSEDSTTTVDASTYTMTIDQLTRQIYNTDSLPAGTDISKVVCTVTSKNSGVVLVKRMESDTIDYYSSSDSIDFTKPRAFLVYSTDGTNYRRYDVTVNVHKQLPDSFVWRSQSAGDLQNTSYRYPRLYPLGDKMVLLASDGNNSSLLYVKDINDDATPWKHPGSNINTVFSPDAYKNACVFGDKLYMLNRGSLYATADGSTWEPVENNLTDNTAQLVGAGKNKMYAITSTGILSSADGKTWAQAQMDADAGYLPTGSISICSLPLKTNSEVERVVMVGNTQKADTAAVVWGKLENASDDNSDFQWSLYEGGYKNLLPNMSGLVVMKYDGNLYAIGGAGLNGSKATAYSTLYCSTDQGMTWHTSSLFTLPQDFPSSADAATICMAADKENNVWLVSLTTNQTWKMRINRLGWKTEQSAFNE